MQAETNEKSLEIYKSIRGNYGIPFFYCIDSGFAKYAAVSSYSLHKSCLIPPRIYWVVADQHFNYTKLVLDQISKFNIDITLIKADESVFSQWKSNEMHTSAMYLRLLIPKLINEDKAIYIDADTLILSDISEIYSINLGDAPLAGVVDPGAHTSNIKLPEGEPYINSGMLLLNLNKLRDDDFIGKCEKIYEEFKEVINYPDQDIINKYAEGKKFILERDIWNYLCQVNSHTESDWLKVKEKAKIVHFLGGIKPWMAWCNPPIAEYWWSFANQLCIEGLEPIPCSSLMHYRHLANCMARNGKTMEAYTLADNLVNHLMQK